MLRSSKRAFGNARGTERPDQPLITRIRTGITRILLLPRPVTATQDEAHALVLRWVLPFLQRYLAGRAAAEPFFRAPPPGATVSQER